MLAFFHLDMPVLLSRVLLISNQGYIEISTTWIELNDAYLLAGIALHHRLKILMRLNRIFRSVDFKIIRQNSSIDKPMGMTINPQYQ